MKRAPSPTTQQHTTTTTKATINKHTVQQQQQQQQQPIVVVQLLSIVRWRSTSIVRSTINRTIAIDIDRMIDSRTLVQ